MVSKRIERAKWVREKSLRKAAAQRQVKHPVEKHPEPSGTPDLRELAAKRDRNWETLKGQESNLQRIIEHAPQTMQDVDFVMKVMIVALSEIVVRRTIESEVDKVVSASL